jgi:hypothetical protein
VFALGALGGARTAAARSPGDVVCMYTPQLAEALLAAHPSADADGDGQVSRAEACDYQAELRRMADAEPALVSALDLASSELLSEPMCCDCSAAPTSPLTSTSEASCPPKEEGTVKR